MKLTPKAAKMLAAAIDNHVGLLSLDDKQEEQELREVMTKLDTGAFEVLIMREGWGKDVNESFFRLSKLHADYVELNKKLVEHVQSTCDHPVSKGVFAPDTPIYLNRTTRGRKHGYSCGVCGVQVPAKESW